MNVEVTYFVATLVSFCDMIGNNGIVYGDDHAYMRKLAEALSEKSDNLIVFGRVDSVPTAAFYNGKELTVAYDRDLNETYYEFKRQSVCRLEELSTGGFYLVEQNLTSPLRCS